MSICQCDQSDTSSYFVRSIPVLVQRTRISSGQRSTGVGYRTGRVSVPEPSSNRNVTLVRMNNVNNPSSSLDNNANSNDHTNALSANNDHTNTDTLPTNKDCSNTFNDDAPPPYSRTSLIC